jgi:hypothetical protein
MSRRVLRAAAGIAIASLAACGSHASGLAPRAPFAQTTQPSARAVSVAFRVAIPKGSQATRRAQYVSASTQSMSIAVGGATAVVNCSSTCEGSIDAPVGDDTFTIKLFDAQNATGNLLATGATTQTIVADLANAVHVTLGGVAAALRLTLHPASIVPGSAGSAAVTVDALDADGNVIIGPGSYVDAAGNPIAIALSDSDTSGTSTLSKTSVSEPTSGIALNYTAALAIPPTITASASGFTDVAATLSLAAPTLTSISAASGLIGTSVTETLTGTNFGANATVSVSGDGITVSNVSVVSATTMQATLFVDPEAPLTDRDVSVVTNVGATDPQTFTPSNVGVDVVTARSDGNAPSGAIAGGGDPGELRYVMQNAAAGDTIVFDTNAMCHESTCSIVLSGALPPIAQDLTIDGGQYGRVTIDGNREYRVFYVTGGTVLLANLEIANGLSHGGWGGDGNGAGGGGAGLGGALLVSDGNVTVRIDFFDDDGVIGGAGGNVNPANAGGGGGGALGGWLAGGGGRGGSAAGSDSGAGGGGILGPGANPGSVTGYCGGNGGAGDGVAGALGGEFEGAPGQVGSSGAGGGGGCLPDTSSFFIEIGPGGKGGFGGGGGGTGGTLVPNDEGELGQAGGEGGWGAGGGGGGSALGYAFTAESAYAGGDGGGTNMAGSGGAAFGPAIFVAGGALVIDRSWAIHSYATGGGGGSGGSSGAPGANGPADATPVYASSGSVNGVTVTGAVPNAMGSTPP